MEVTSVGDIDNRIAKLEEELGRLKSIRNIPLKLSSVYPYGLTYGIAYLDGHGTIEMLHKMDNQPQRLIPLAQEQCFRFVESKLFIVGCRPEKIVRVVNH